MISLFDQDTVLDRFARFDELDPAQLADWFSASELTEASGWRHPRRLRAWQAGRLLAKRLLLEAGVWGPRQISVLSRSTSGESVRPRILIGGHELDWSVSIAHSDRGVLVALSMAPGVDVGVDLAPIQSRNAYALGPWMESRERRTLETLDCEAWTTAWAVKEAAYKCTNHGEPFAPRRFVTSVGEGGRWTCHRVGDGEPQNLSIECRRIGREVAAIATWTHRGAHIEGAAHVRI
jgi:phosphopantetheinyl transferase